MLSAALLPLLILMLAAMLPACFYYVAAHEMPLFSPLLTPLLTLSICRCLYDAYELFVDI